MLSHNFAGRPQMKAPLLPGPAHAPAPPQRMRWRRSVPELACIVVWVLGAWFIDMAFYDVYPEQRFAVMIVASMWPVVSIVGAFVYVLFGIFAIVMALIGSVELAFAAGNLWLSPSGFNATELYVPGCWCSANAIVHLRSEAECIKFRARLF